MVLLKMRQDLLLEVVRMIIKRYLNLVSFSKVWSFTLQNWKLEHVG